MGSLATLLPNVDRAFNVKADINLILSAEAFEEILARRIKTGNSLLVQETKLGWTLSGKMTAQVNQVAAVLSNISTVNFNRALQRFFDSDTQ